jgi:hypothetical protein
MTRLLYRCLLALMLVVPVAPGWSAENTTGALPVRPLFATPKALRQAFASLAIKPKDEFETKAQYGERACEALWSKLGGSAASWFVLPVFSNYEPNDNYYNAEDQAYKFIAMDFFTSGYFEFLPYNYGLDLVQTKKVGKSYVGVNAFGVREDISVATFDEVALLLNVKTPSKYVDSEPRYSVPAQAARSLKGDLRLVVVTQIVPPCIERATKKTSPTIDDPQERTHNVIGLVAGPGARWEIIRASTGEVLASGEYI